MFSWVTSFEPAWPSCCPSYHMRLTHQSGPRSHHPGHMSRRWGCSGHWHRRTGWVGRCALGIGMGVSVESWPPFLIFLSFSIILCVIGSLPKSLEAISLRKIQNHLCGLMVAASPHLSRGLWYPSRRSTLPCSRLPSRAELCPPLAQSSQPTLCFSGRGQHPSPPAWGPTLSAPRPAFFPPPQAPLPS